MKKHFTFSVIIPFKKKTHYIDKCLAHLKVQTYSDFEVQLLPDNKLNVSINARVIATGEIGPAEKRDLGAKYARGKIIAFIDDDAYPHPDWLKQAVKHFKDPQVAAVGGPGITPKGVSWRQQASGWVSASPVGSGGLSFRFIPQKMRLVDDYPSMNLIINRKDFLAVGGFDSSFWPGEDTKLCLDLVYKLGKKIIYDPKVIVYHHRRPLWLSHLRQNGNFGLHRGYFARVLPKTSARLTYFIPSLLFIGLLWWLLLLVIRIFSDLPGIIQASMLVVELAAVIYSVVLILNALWITRQSGKITQGLISIPAVFLTHLIYGVRFIEGFFFTRKLRR